MPPDPKAFWVGRAAAHRKVEERSALLAEVAETVEAIIVRIRALSAGEGDGDGESLAETEEPEEE